MPYRSAALGSVLLLAWTAIECGRPASGADLPARSQAPDRDDDRGYRWSSLPIEIAGLPPKAEAVPVACAVDFSALLARLGLEGLVDERSLRLYRLGGDGGRVEEP